MKYISAEIEEYEEANSSVKLAIYKVIKEKGNEYITLIAEIPEMPRVQAEAAMAGFNRGVPGLAGAIARFEYMKTFL